MASHVPRCISKTDLRSHPALKCLFLPIDCNDMLVWLAQMQTPPWYSLGRDAMRPPLETVFASLELFKGKKQKQKKIVGVKLTGTFWVTEFWWAGSSYHPSHKLIEIRLNSWCLQICLNLQSAHLSLCQPSWLNISFPSLMIISLMCLERTVIPCSLHKRAYFLFLNLSKLILSRNLIYEMLWKFSWPFQLPLSARS